MNYLFVVAIVLHQCGAGHAFCRFHGQAKEAIQHPSRFDGSASTHLHQTTPHCCCDNHRSHHYHGNHNFGNSNTTSDNTLSECCCLGEPVEEHQHDCFVSIQVVVNLNRYSDDDNTAHADWISWFVPGFYDLTNPPLTKSDIRALEKNRLTAPEVRLHLLYESFLI